MKKYILGLGLLYSSLMSGQNTDSVAFSQSYNVRCFKDSEKATDVVCNVIYNNSNCYVEFFAYTKEGELLSYYFLSVGGITQYADSTMKYYIRKDKIENPNKIKWVVLHKDYLNLKHKHNFLTRCYVLLYNKPN